MKTESVYPLGAISDSPPAGRMDDTSSDVIFSSVMLETSRPVTTEVLTSIVTRKPTQAVRSTNPVTVIVTATRPPTATTEIENSSTGKPSATRRSRSTRSTSSVEITASTGSSASTRAATGATLTTVTTSTASGISQPSATLAAPKSQPPPSDIAVKVGVPSIIALVLIITTAALLWKFRAKLSLRLRYDRKKIGRRSKDIEDQARPENDPVTAPSLPQSDKADIAMQPICARPFEALGGEEWPIERVTHRERRGSSSSTLSSSSKGSQSRSENGGGNVESAAFDIVAWWQSVYDLS